MMRLIEAETIPFSQAMLAYRKRPLRSEARLVATEGLDPGWTTYNGFPLVDPNGKLHLLSRVERLHTEDSQVISLDFATCHTSLNGFVAPDGLVIPEAQDPSVSFFAPNKIAIGVVAITGDRGKVTAYWPQIYEFEDGVVSKDRIARGPEFQKDVRVTYVGSFGEEDLTAIVTRERQDNARSIRSYLQVGIAPTATDMLQLSRDIIQVKNDPASRLDVLLPDNRTWFGPNQIIPLQSQDGDLAFGLLFHTGRFTNRLYGNGERGRDYTALVTEISANPETRQVTHFTKPKIIATVDIFPYTQAKRPDLFNVLFPGGLVFGITRGVVVQTILVCGLRDRYNGLVEISYPFSRPPDLKLNRLSILPAEKMPNS